MPKKIVNWRLYERDYLYPQNLSAYLDLARLGPSKKYPYVANHYEVMTFENGYLWWARDADAIEKTARKWVKNWLTAKRELKSLLLLFKGLEDKTKKILPPLKKIPVKSVSDKELYNLYEKTKNIFLSSVVFNEYAIDLFDDFFDKIFREKLQELTKGKITQTEISKILKPAQITESLKYRKRILELSLLKNISTATLDKISCQFNWIAMGWDGSNEMTVGQLKSDLTGLKKVNVNSRRKELQRIKNFSRLVKSERTRILKKYRLSLAQLKPYFFILDNFVVFHDRRKENQMRCNQIIFPALKEMSKRFKVKYNNLLFYFNPDIKKLCLQGKKVSALAIRERKRGITFVVKEGKVKEFFGAEAKKVLEKLVFSNFKIGRFSEISGEPASPGKIKGKAFVTKNAKVAIKGLNKGEILITTMTTVDFLPVMYKAGAIVTDDGGVTCHAAIVSRELGKPCVVGTKIATRVFKTGDLIEVDANKGIVRKIWKK